MVPYLPRSETITKFRGMTHLKLHEKERSNRDRDSKSDPSVVQNYTICEPSVKVLIRLGRYKRHFTNRMRDQT